MENRYASVAYATLGTYDRVIAISDIHGDPEGFDAVLKKTGFSDRDALVIIGDILEKGAHSLELLQTVVRLSRQDNVFMVLGNNDATLQLWHTGELSDDAIHRYIHSRDYRSVFADMAQALHLPVETESDVHALRLAVQEHFREELAFLDSLPHILDTDIATFVHAGLKPGPLDTQDRWFCMAEKHFSRQTHRFDKPLVVGHWPSSNYRDTIVDVRVHFNPDTNVYSIDGGNSMKNWGQINYLIFHADGQTETGFHEAQRQVRLLEAQCETPDPVTMIFPNTVVEILEQLPHETRCFVPYLGKEMTFGNDFIYDYNDLTYCWDFTTYRLPVRAGEIVSYCYQEGDAILVKRDGIVGKYFGAYEFLDEPDKKQS